MQFCCSGLVARIAFPGLFGPTLCRPTDEEKMKTDKTGLSTILGLRNLSIAALSYAASVSLPGRKIAIVHGGFYFHMF